MCVHVPAFFLVCKFDRATSTSDLTENFSVTERQQFFLKEFHLTFCQQVEIAHCENQVFWLFYFCCPQPDDLFPLLGKFPRTFGTPPQGTTVNELVMLAAVFAVEMHLVATASAEIPKLWAFVQTVEFCPYCFVEQVVFADE
jgi:hypothetical protein